MFSNPFYIYHFRDLHASLILNVPELDVLAVKGPASSSALGKARSTPSVEDVSINQSFYVASLGEDGIGVTTASVHSVW